ncbi:MAG: phosphatidate cytidylyltransferase [Acidobacteria bacterium]|nr:phosphatidate cytidylyltransferase [Acidobacteriota bacterium]
MTRVLSGAVLLVLAMAVVWLAPQAIFFGVAELLLVLALIEYVALARTCGLPVPAIPAGVAAMLTCAAFAQGLTVPLEAVLMSALVALGALTLTTWSGGRDALGSAAASIFPSLYLGLPIGAMVAIRDARGREALVLLMLTVVVSDTAQYYSGRAFGRRPLAPAISPKKTVEGAIGGLLSGAMVLAVVGAWWLPVIPLVLRVLFGVTIVALGIAGDLFESMLKRSAGVKDSSSLIPGHGGILDRIDALLFAAPVYYVVLKYV